MVERFRRLLLLVDRSELEGLLGEANFELLHLGFGLSSSGDLSIVFISRHTEALESRPGNSLTVPRIKHVSGRAGAER